MSASRLVRCLKPIICNNYIVPTQSARTFHRWVAPTLKVLYKRKKEMGPQPPTPRSNFIEWNYKAELYAFGKRLGEEFKDDILRQAFIEESYIKMEEEKQKSVGIEPQLELRDNKQLAKEGEEFIGKVTQTYLETVLPSLPAEFIQAIKNDLLKEESLAHISQNIGINDLLLSADFPPTTSSLCRGFQAVVQALALSSGPDKASIFVRDFVLTQLAGKDISPLCSPKNPLQVLESTVGSAVEPRLIIESGKNSLLANYQVGIYRDKKLIGRGCGESPQIAEDMAALDGLWRIWGVPPNRRPFPFKLELLPIA